MLRAIRDELALVTGMDQLGQLFTGSFLIICLLALLMSLFRKAVNGMWVLCLLMILLLFAIRVNATLGHHIHGLAFMLISAANLLLISQFWAVLLTSFDKTAAQRHYPLILSVGGLGALTGPWLIMQMATGTPWMLYGMAVLLLTFCCGMLSLVKPMKNENQSDQVSAKAKAHPLRLAAMIFIYSIMGTLVYAEQLDVLTAAELAQADRLRFFGRRDLWIGFFTILLQWLSLRFKQAIFRQTGFQWMPLLTWGILLALGFNGSLEVVLWSMVIFRSVNYACIRPTREVYFFQLGRHSRFKHFIDTVTYRAGDLVGIWCFQWWQQSQLGYTQLALSLLPLVLIWFILNQKIVKSLKLQHE